MTNVKIITAAILVTAIASLICAGSAYGADFYIAVNGCDSNPGTESKPFATIGRARDAVRERITDGLNKNINVLIRGGTYFLSEPLVFTPEDSGTPDYAVTYAACPGAQVILSGGRAITGWVQVDPAKNLWKALLPDVQAGSWWFRQLFTRDKRLTRARFPNTEPLLEVQQVSDDFRRFVLDRSIDVSDPADQRTELVMYQIWSTSRALLDSCTGGKVSAANPVGWIGHKSTSAAVGRKLFLEHAREFLDAPGEWFLDRTEGAVYYLAEPGENPNAMKIIAPRIKQLLRIEGRKENPVKNIHFEGIEFEHAAWALPSFGYSGIQACHYGTTYGLGGEITWSAKPAILLENAHYCSLSGGRIVHTGATGIALGRGCRYNHVSGNELSDVGGNAVVVGWDEKERADRDEFPDDRLQLDWADPLDAPCGNSVCHNVIHHCATVQFGGVGVQALFSRDSVVTHNLICYQPYTGISAGLIWNDIPTTQKGNIISHNYIHHVMQALHDGGGIYTLGYQPGTRVENNLIHDVINGHGLYTDEGSSHLLFQNNIVYRAGIYSYQHHYCHDNIIRNNIFASAGKSHVRRSRGDKDILKGISFSIDRNIFWIDNNEDVFIHDHKKQRANDYFMMDYNLFWPVDGNTLSFDGQSLEVWRNHGHDRHSIITDPGFIDPANGDFRLTHDSPAFDLHFEPIDMSAIGPQLPFRQRFDTLLDDYLLCPMVAK